MVQIKENTNDTQVATTAFTRDAIATHGATLFIRNS